VDIAQQLCTGKPVSGNQTFPVTGFRMQATISRHGQTYGTGRGVSRADGSSWFVITPSRPLTGGNYMLTVVWHHAGRRVVEHRTLIVR
jgi:hypothetical protein